MNLDLVYNPVSGSFRQARLDALVAAFSAHGWTVRLIPSARRWRPADDVPDLVCVHGGDGTLRDSVQTLGPLAASVPLCIAPAGTINLVAREIGYARDPAKLAAQVSAAWRKGACGWLAAPLYTLGEMPVVACLSIGPDSHAVASISGELKKRIGRLAYAVAMMRLLRRWPVGTMTVRGETTEGERFEVEAGAVIASHGALYAGPFRLSPKAALATDGVELIVLNRSSRLATVAFAFAAMLHVPFEKLGLAKLYSVRRVEFDRCVSPVQVDGDHIPDCAYAIGPSGMSLRYVI